MKRKNIGSTLDSLFEETGELEEINERVAKRMFADQLRQVMDDQALSASEVARRMGTSRMAVQRILDPAFQGSTLESLVRASMAVGGRLEPRLVIAPPLRASRTASAAKKAARARKGPVKKKPVGRTIRTAAKRA